jgi:hypothetical protein
VTAPHREIGQKTLLGTASIAPRALSERVATQDQRDSVEYSLAWKQGARVGALSIVA